MHVACAVVFCPMDRFTFSIGTILPAPVPAPWVVNNPCPRRLSPVANSVAFFSVSLFLSYLAVDLPTLFSVKEPWCNNTCPNRLFCLFLCVSMSSPLVSSSTVLVLHHSFRALSRISLTCDAKSTFQMLQSFFCQSFAVSMSLFHMNALIMHFLAGGWGIHTWDVSFC